MIYLQFSLVFMAGALIVWLVEREKRAALKSLRDKDAKQMAEAQQLLRQMGDRMERIAQERTAAIAERDSMSQRAQMLQQQVSDERGQSRQALDDLRMAAADEKSQLRQLYVSQLQELKDQHESQLQQQLQLLREQFSTASERILAERSQQLGEHNRQQMDSILTPLMQNIELMRTAVEKSDREHVTSMERLDATIRSSIRTTVMVGERADRLAQALTNENKTQGNFGELRLRQLLQDMGLEEGLQFEEQVTMRDAGGQAVHDTEQGHRLQPDVILHFPDKRDVIIDSKMSFKAFVEYQNAADDDARADALRRHVASVRAHVAELSRKDYSRYVRDGHASLDFVLMYVFQEGALQLALANDPTLWKDAYDRHVIITGSQNLYALLRVLELAWRQVRQVQNQQQIMRCANEIVNRTQLFYERLLKVEEQLDKTRKAFDDVKVSAGPSGNSIITSARQLIGYGATQNPKRKARLDSVAGDGDGD